jgi:outer membrane protein assembly factor BamB
LVATFDSRELFCIAPDGQALWDYIAESSTNAAAVTGNIVGDAKRGIVAAAPGRQTVFALDSNGALLWRVRLPGDSLSRRSRSFCLRAATNQRPYGWPTKTKSWFGCPEMGVSFGPRRLGEPSTWAAE